MVSSRSTSGQYTMRREQIRERAISYRLLAAQERPRTAPLPSAEELSAMTKKSFDAWHAREAAMTPEERIASKQGLRRRGSISSAVHAFAIEDLAIQLGHALSATQVVAYDRKLMQIGEDAVAAETTKLQQLAEAQDQPFLIETLESHFAAVAKQAMAQARSQIEAEIAQWHSADSLRLAESVPC